jgi:FHA domain-containing protein/double zinc ribbon protein
MSQVLCPNGHMSADPEWCDTCGARLGAAPAAAPASADPAGTPLSTPPSGAPVGGLDSVPCPHCGAANTADALFCEDCGYDFTTGQAPEPVPTGTVPVVSGAAPASSASAVSTPSADQTAPAPGPPGWIVIVEIDPKWFELKGTLADQPCPQPSSSTIPLALATVHIGRSSQSRGIHPEIAMDSDTAVSRQHAQLVATSSTGDSAAEPDSYAVVDLGSTNGTFVVKAGLEPDAAIEPIAPRTQLALADGDRVYIGAWSRLTVRNTMGA